MFDLILASGSPIRASLLENAGYEFQQVTSFVNEDYSTKNSYRGNTRIFGTEKSSKQWQVTNPQSTLIIGCDQIMVNDDKDPKVMGKVESAQEAYDRLWSLRGKSHRFISAAVGVYGQTLELAFSCQQEVKIQIS